MNILPQIWDIRTAKLVTSLNCKTNEDSEFLYCAQVLPPSQMFSFLFSGFSHRFEALQMFSTLYH